MKKREKKEKRLEEGIAQFCPVYSWLFLQIIYTKVNTTLHTCTTRTVLTFRVMIPWEKWILSKGETVLARRSGYHIEVTKLVFLFYSDLI